MTSKATLNRRHALLGLSSLALLPSAAGAQTPAKTVRIIVALADNKNQGIVPTSAKLGNGQDPRNNLYWGALYGVRSYFGRSDQWSVLKARPTITPPVLDAVSFAHPSMSNPSIVITAEAWDGAYMKEAITAFYSALSNAETGPDLTIFVGHNGLMDKLGLTAPDVSAVVRQSNQSHKRAAMVYACASGSYFDDDIRALGVEPLVTTRGLMAPEAYSIDPAIRAWAKGDTPDAVRQAAAAGYAKYQKIPLRNAQRLFGATR